MKSLVLILTIASVSILMGMSECGSCPETQHFMLTSGTYSQVEIIEISPPTNGTPPFPHFDATNIRMSVDVAQKTVVIQYQKEGKNIVETWRW